MNCEAREAITYLTFAIGWGGGVIPVYLNGSRHPDAYVQALAGERLAKRAAYYDLRQNAQVEVGLPEERPDTGGAASSTVLWAWLESRDSAVRAWRRFRPTPPVVLRMGSSARRLAIWPLRESLPYNLAESANKRIAYALHAPQKYAGPEKLRIPLPGTFLRAGRVRPAPVLPTRLELDTYSRAEIVERLRDPPAPYIQRLREGMIPGRS